ncbi:hypothetical protein [Terrilactibacillus tamarindi]|uniref:hypothetical protein n=1 Tax=Terrilactibacillus tamarindi TaxID=2599694 RepID=UPI0018AD1AAD|nr:hypothetical protein [Terrilactibacillus tamarindi]
MVVSECCHQPNYSKIIQQPIQLIAQTAIDILLKEISLASVEGEKKPPTIIIVKGAKAGGLGHKCRRPSR